MTSSRFNLTYQLDRHCAAHAYQWPHADRRQTRRDVRRLLTEGRAWLWPEPVQLEMFQGQAV